MIPRGLIAAALSLLAAASLYLVARADTPASSVRTAPVGPGQNYPEVSGFSESWYDVGGFCKVVDVGDLSQLPSYNPSRPSDGTYVFIPGSATQWENYRSAAPAHYAGQLVLTTCCRPQANIATLCASASNPQSVSRQYGKLGEVDTVAAVCLGTQGQYRESVNVSCAGDNGPDGQGGWVEGTISDVCAPNTNTVLGTCTAPGNCGTGSQSVTVLDSCGVVTLVTSQVCNTGVACCTPGQNVICGACGSNKTASCTDSCGNVTTQTCSPDDCPATRVMWEEDVNEQVNLCSATLPAVSWKAGGSYSVSQAPTASNNYYTGQISYPLRCQGDIFVENGPVVPTWSYENTDGNYVPLGQPAYLDPGTTDGYPTGSCYPAQCEGTVTWSVAGNSCSAQNVAINENQTATVYTINNSPSEVGGTAQVTCNAQLQFTVLPGATCGPGQCVPKPGYTIGDGGCPDPCVGYVHTYDSCGNLISEQSCYSINSCSSTCAAVANGTTGPAPGCAVTCNSGYTLSGGACVSVSACPTVANGTTGPAPGCAVTCNSGYTLSGGACVANSTAPTYCAPGTVFSSCELETYTCQNGVDVPYDDCGGSCRALNSTSDTPGISDQSTWNLNLPLQSPICGNGSQCQYGYQACLTNTLFSPGLLTSLVCKNADGSATCSSPSYPQP